MAVGDNLNDLEMLEYAGGRSSWATGWRAAIRTRLGGHRFERRGRRGARDRHLRPGRRGQRFGNDTAWLWGSTRSGFRAPRGHARGDRTPARRPRRRRTPKKKLTTSAAWREARELMWARRGRLLLGLALMLVNRLSGLVLPATSKYLIDDVIGRDQPGLLMPLALVAGAATLVQAVTVVRAVAGPRRSRAARDHRHAPARRGARRAAARRLLRFDPDRHPDLADHDGRRGHPEPGRHRPRPAHRQHRHSDRRAGLPLLSELAAHLHHDRRARRIRRRRWRSRSTACGRSSANAERSTPR